MIKLKDLLFEEKLNEEAKGYKQALQKFIKYGNKQIKAYFKKNLDKTYERGQYRQLAVLKPGKKYDRVVNVRADEPKKSDGGVHCFIERETGLIYKPKGWTGPAKGPRASIFKPATYKKIDPHGSWLYKFMKEGKLNEGPEFEKGDTVSLLSFDRRQKGKVKVIGVTKAKKNKFGIKHHYITNKGTFSDMEVVGTEAYKLRFKGNTEKKVMKAMGI